MSRVGVAGYGKMDLIGYKVPELRTSLATFMALPALCDLLTIIAVLGQCFSFEVPVDL